MAVVVSAAFVGVVVRWRLSNAALRARAPYSVEVGELPADYDPGWRRES